MIYKNSNLKKKFDPTLPIISIITVVYNDKLYLEETIFSTINQKYQNIEYIIIDGGSSDGSLDIIKKYQHKINIWISEKDRGIYDAMNKGFKIASGEWINFMNSGDTFVSNDVIHKIHFKNFQRFSMIYGSSNIFNESRKFIKKLDSLICNKVNLTLFGTRTVCHQAIFYNAKIKFHYPMRYFLKGELYSYFEYIKHSPALRINFVICNYYLGGAGMINNKLNTKEKWEVLKEQVGFLRYLHLPVHIYSKIRLFFVKNKKL